MRPEWQVIVNELLKGARRDAHSSAHIGGICLSGYVGRQSWKLFRYAPLWNFLVTTLAV